MALAAFLIIERKGLLEVISGSLLTTILDLCINKGINSLRDYIQDRKIHLLKLSKLQLWTLKWTLVSEQMKALDTELISSKECQIALIKIHCVRALQTECMKAWHTKKLWICVQETDRRKSTATCDTRRNQALKKWSIVLRIEMRWQVLRQSKL